MKKYKSTETFYQPFHYQNSKEKQLDILEFETSSSVSHSKIWGQANSHQDSELVDRIGMLEQKVQAMSSACDSNLASKRKRLREVQIKVEQAAEKQTQQAIQTRNLIEQTHMVAEFMIRKVKDNLQHEFKKVKHFYELEIEQLHEQLKQEVEHRQNMVRQLQNTSKSLHKSKQHLKKFLINYLKSDSTIKQLENKLEQLLINYKENIKKSRQKLEQQMTDMSEYVQLVENQLNEKLKYEHISRQRNKQRILEKFERLCLEKNIDIY